MKFMEAEFDRLDKDKKGQSDVKELAQYNWTAAGMFSVYWPTQGRTRNVTGESAAL
jgi:hypothetical protein